MAKNKLAEGIDPEQPAFLRVPVKCIATVVAALAAAGFKQEAKSVEEFTKDYTDPKLNAEREKWIERAGGKDGEFEFDTDSTISHSDDDGEYVLGWVWVYGPKNEEEVDENAE